MLGDVHSGTLFFDPRFRGDPVHLLLHLRVTSVFFFLLFLRISPINNNSHHHNVYLVPRILKTTFNTTSTIKAHWGSAASGVSLLNIKGDSFVSQKWLENPLDPTTLILNELAQTLLAQVLGTQKPTYACKGRGYPQANVANQQAEKHCKHPFMHHGL